MKYAIFSDIHGNDKAFAAALADAQSQGAEQYLLLGDYVTSFPWGNEVVSLIRSLRNAVVIRGNGDAYLSGLRDNPPGNFDNEQMKPAHWSYKKLSADNFDYLSALPDTANVTADGVEIRLAHSNAIFIRSPKIDWFSSFNYRKLMQADPFTHDTYLSRAKDALLAHSDAVREINALPEGVYLFGHNHLQFYMEHKGRLFINPGSCGLNLDWDITVPYTLLELSNGRRTVTERRVSYDLPAAVQGLTDSGYAAYAPVWSEIMKKEIFTAKDYFTQFVRHLAAANKRFGQEGFPVNNAVWAAAADEWDLNAEILNYE